MTVSGMLCSRGRVGHPPTSIALATCTQSLVPDFLASVARLTCHTSVRQGTRKSAAPAAFTSQQKANPLPGVQHTCGFCLQHEKLPPNTAPLRCRGT